MPWKGSPATILPSHQAQVFLHCDGGWQARTLYGKVGFPCGKLYGRESLPLALLSSTRSSIAASCRALRTSIVVGSCTEGVKGVEGDRLVSAEHGAAPGARNTLSRLHRKMAAHSLHLSALPALTPGRRWKSAAVCNRVGDDAGGRRCRAIAWWSTRHCFSSAWKLIVEWVSYCQGGSHHRQARVWLVNWRPGSGGGGRGDGFQSWAAFPMECWLLLER